MPMLLTSAWKGLLGENAFDLPKMEEGFLSDGIGICDPTGSRAFGRCARSRESIRDAKSANDGGGEGRAVLDRNEGHTEAIVLFSRRVGSNRSASHLCATADWSREDGKRVFPTKVGFGQ